MTPLLPCLLAGLAGLLVNVGTFIQKVRALRLPRLGLIPKPRLLIPFFLDPLWMFGNLCNAVGFGLYLYTLRYVKTLKEGKYEAYESVDFDQVSHTATYLGGEVVEIPPRVQDVLSSLYYIRTMDLEVGKSVFINNHADEKNYPLEVKVLRIEKIKVPAGTYECYVLEPILRASGVFQHKGKLTVWMSTDPSRIPVMMKSKILIGAINAVLIEADTGR